MAELGARVTERVEHEVHRRDFGIRLIIALKVLKATVLVAFAITVLSLAHSDIHDSATRMVSWLGINPAGPRVEHLLAHLIGVTPLRLEEIGAGALVIACVMLLEGWGLHRRRVWAEWLTIGVTTSLIPLEIYELARGASVGKVVTLLANVAIVIYLARHRALFSPGRIGRWFKAKLGRG